MEKLTEWLEANKICFKQIDDEVVEVDGFGKFFVTDLSEVQSIFRGTKDKLIFNLMENPEVLIGENIFFVAFPFGRNWYYYDLREEFKFNILKYIGKRKPATIDIPYVNLGIHTPYELLNGSGSINTWIKKAKALSHNAIGICDYNTMAATLTLQKECAKEGLKHIFGYTLTAIHEGNKISMKVYCQTQKGLRNLLRIHKCIMVDSADGTIALRDLIQYAEGNVLVLGKHSSYWMKDNMHILALLKNEFEQLYYQVDLSEYKAERIDAAVLMATKYYFDNFYRKEDDLFLVEPLLLCDNYYVDKDDARNKIILNKIATGAAHEQSDDQYFKDIDEHYRTIQAIFSTEKWNIEKVFSRMCTHTVKIAENASAGFELGNMFMPCYIMTEEERRKYNDRRSMFYGLLEEGLRDKIQEPERQRYRERLKEEAYIIESTNNVDYFLIQWDMIKEARRRNIAVGVGRGSAGGSLISYLLGIITIDPLKYDLLFSRFLVPERCGLNWVDEITVMTDNIHVLPGNLIMEINLNGKKILFDKDAKFKIVRNGAELKVYADELEAGDDILFDTRDLLWRFN